MATELIAHRGASREHRENTLPAFARALELHADGIELDTHATSDGVVVVHHDPVPRAVSPDAALIGRPFPELTAREVASFRFPDGSHIPTLGEVVELVGDRAVLYIEVKARRIENEVIACMRGTRSTFALHSFDHDMIRRVHARDPRIRTGILTLSYLLDPETALRETGATDYWQSGEFADADLLERIHTAGARLIVWTVNSAEQAGSLRAGGADGICSDDIRIIRPAVMVRA